MTEKDVPAQEKVTRVGRDVQSRITPMLDSIKKGLFDALARSQEVKAKATNGTANGNGHAHAEHD